MKDRLQQIANVVIIAGVLLSASVLVRREFLSNSRARTEQVRAELLSKLRAVARPFGPEGGSLDLIVVGDFECPACRTFERMLADYRRLHPGRIVSRFVHYPLAYHPNALKAATASECAGAQKRFGEYHDSLFAGQDTLSRMDYVALAHAVAIPDSSQFVSCMAAPTNGRLDASKSVVDNLGIRGTPTIVMNGWRLSTPPTPEQLDSAFAALVGRR